jgi:hypothetical protein
LKPPAALSPSSIAEFLACPQSFLFQYILGIKQPTNLALLRGRLCHSSLDQLFDLPPHDRNVTNLHNLFRKNYREQRNQYLHLFQGGGNNTNHSTVAEEGKGHGGDSVVGTPVAAGASAVDERTWGKESLQMLTNYLNEEDVSLIKPAQREVWVRADLPALHSTEDPQLRVDELNGNGTTMSSLSDENGTGAQSTFLVRGIVDRLDLASGRQGRGQLKSHPPLGESDGVVGALLELQDDDNDDDQDDAVDPIVLSVVDYKTSQRPVLKYSPAMNRKIRDQSFFQLQIYALLLHERQKARRMQLKQQSQKQQEEAIVKGSIVSPDWDDHNDEDGSMFLPVRFLHLLYLNSPHVPRAQRWTLDLGSTRRQRQRVLDGTKSRLQDIHRDIVKLVERQDFRAFVGCDRSFCYCHVCRPRFRPGTVWEPPTTPLTVVTKSQR